MTLTPTTFRQMLPEFNDTGQYSNANISQWLGIAYTMLREEAWWDSLDMGAALFTAHNLVLSARDAKVAENGGIPGNQSGPMSSKSVGGVSASYAVNAAYLEDAGAYNLTSYGSRFWTLVRQFGMGGFQL